MDMGFFPTATCLVSNLAVIIIIITIIIFSLLVDSEISSQNLRLSKTDRLFLIS